MSEYHKIQSVFKRDPANKHKTFLMGEFTRPEFEYLAHLPWRGTEKIDGTNIRIYHPGHEVRGLLGSGIAGRTDNAQLSPKLLPVLQKIQALMGESELPSDTVLYGEGYGAGIQSGGNYRQDQDFVLFDVMISGNWQPWDNVQAIAGGLGLAVTPEVGVHSLTDWVEAVEQAARNGEPLDQPHLNLRESYLHPGAPAEGVVLRPLVELLDRSGERIITKLKFKDFR